MKTVKLMNKENPAPLWKRFLAYIIDVLAINIAAILPLQSILINSESNVRNLLLRESSKEIAAVSILIMLFTIFYFAALELKTKQTLGKIIMNIYVTSTDKTELTLSQAILRNITKPFTLVLIIDVLYMIFKRTNQRLFEVFSRTQVVERGMLVR
ncbi:MAG TPA: RDD family protein [Candidatus Nanoarchaeia archaeon]|nr:RDD family protein [Candidatus Nanoarchaeia archaeon]